jgi:hypothetical protein
MGEDRQSSPRPEPDCPARGGVRPFWIFPGYSAMPHYQAGRHEASVLAAATASAQ